MHHNLEEHDSYYYVVNRMYGAMDFPAFSKLSPNLQASSFLLDKPYKGKAQHDYIADAFNMAERYGMSGEYLLGNDFMYVDIHPEYYAHVIRALNHPAERSHYLQAVENDMILKRFALQLDINSGEWTQSYKYATELDTNIDTKESITSNDKHLPYYLISIIMQVLAYIEKRDSIELVDKHGQFDYHLGFTDFPYYSPKMFGTLLRAAALSNTTRLKVINPDSEGRVGYRNTMAVIDAIQKINELDGLFKSIYDYRVYSEWLDSPVANTFVMVNNLLTIFNPSGHHLQPNSGEVERMANFINQYGYEKAILAVHNHGYSLEALEIYDGMPKRWVKNMLDDYPYDYKNMVKIIHNT